MSAGLFELRKDPITGWWVATIVDRDFDRSRFARPAAPIDDGGDCQNCRLPTATASASASSRTTRSTSSAPRRKRDELDRGHRPGHASPTPARRAAGARSSRRRASIGPLAQVGEVAERDARRARATPSPRRRTAAQTDYLQVVQNWGAQAGARTNHLCLDLYDLPLIPHRVARGARRRGAVRDPRGRVPLVPPRPRGVPDARAARLGGRADRRVRAVGLALAVRGLDRAPRPRGRLRPRRRRGASAPPRPRSATCSARLGGQPRRPAVQPRPPHRAAARARRRAPSTGTGRSIRACARSPASSSGTGLPVNPVSPEAAVEELLDRPAWRPRRRRLERRRREPRHTDLAGASSLATDLPPSVRRFRIRARGHQHERPPRLLERTDPVAGQPSRLAPSR